MKFSLPDFSWLQKKKKGRSRQRSVLHISRPERRSRMQTSGVKNKVVFLLKRCSRLLQGHSMARILLIVLGLTLTLTVLGLVLFSRMFEVSEINVVRNDFFVPADLVEESMKEVIGKNIFLVQTRDWEKTIEAAFPIMKKVTINKMFPRALQVRLESYDIVATVSHKGSEKVYLLAENGVVIEDENVVAEGASERSDNLLHMQIPVYQYDEAKAPVISKRVALRSGQRFMSEEYMQDIMNVLEIYDKNFPMKITMVEYLPLEEELHLHTDQGSQVLFWLKEPVETQLYKLKWKLHEPGLDITKDNISYIDLRIPDRVDVCLTTERCSSFVGSAM